MHEHLCRHVGRRRFSSLLALIYMPLHVYQSKIKVVHLYATRSSGPSVALISQPTSQPAKVYQLVFGWIYYRQRAINYPFSIHLE